MPDATAGRPSTLDHLRSKKKPNRLSVSFCLDSELASAFQSASVDFDMARSRAADVDLAPDERERADRALEDAEAALVAAREAAESVTYTFRFKSIGRKAYEDLMLAHPATEKDNLDADKLGQPRTEWSPASFPQALVAACIDQVRIGDEKLPPMSEDDVKALWDDDSWTGTEVQTLWQYALSVNQQSRVIDLGKGSGTTRG